jgi:pimeloyl-ACP methyl ester carboxylesterase
MAKLVVGSTALSMRVDTQRQFVHHQSVHVDRIDACVASIVLAAFIGTASTQRWYIRIVRALLNAIATPMLVMLFAQGTGVQAKVSLPTEDGGLIYANVYGDGVRAVVLAHGGRFNKESWEKQARTLVSAGFRVLALDFRGYGKSRGPGESDPMDAPLHLDVLAAVRYLRSTGARTVSIVGASMGAGAAGDASIASQPGEIDRLVFLGGAPNGAAEKLKSPSLFIVARNDTSGDGPRLPGIQKQYDKAPQPKSLIILDGSAHAQYLFQTEQADRVMREILHFLSAK